MESGQALYPPAIVGLAWVALARDRPSEAQKIAERAIAIAANSPYLHPVANQNQSDVGRNHVEVHVALGLSLMRQPGKLSEAEQTFRAAATMEPAAYRYQARSWLALVHLAQDKSVEALTEGQAAVQSAPQSALARGNLALVFVFNDKPLDALREARFAINEKPNSVAAQCVLGQALLAQGDVDRAAQTAGQAVALDPKLPQAHYISGIAEAQRRNYSQATRSLKETLQLAPDFMRAASALARVYNRMGRSQESVTLLTDQLIRHPQSDQLLAALGGVLYEQGKYDSAVTHYRQAIGLKPNSGLYRAELARTLLDANRLSEAIIEGQKAVRLAPEVGQYHAILGLAYDFSGLTLQSEREFRQALALDPQNALAHLVLGLKAAQAGAREQRVFSRQSQSLGDLLTQALRAVGSSPSVSSITQAFLYDPAISAQVLRGGIGAELSMNGGNNNPINPSATHRGRALDGAFHSLGIVDRVRDSGIRQNADSTTETLSQNMTYVTDPRTSLFARYSNQRSRQGLAGTVSNPDFNDRTNNREDLAQFAMRRRMGGGDYFWLGLTRPSGRIEFSNPDRDTNLLIPTPDGNGITLGALSQRANFSTLIPEFRMEFAFNRAPNRPTVLSIGATHVNLEPVVLSDLLFPVAPPGPSVVIPLGVRLDGRRTVSYAQLTQRLHDRLSVAAQISRQELKTTRTEDFLGGGSQSFSASESHWLPSLLANYRADDRTMLRLFFNRKAQGQELNTVALRPLDTLLATEPLVLTKGSPNESETFELDAERYLSSRDFLKLFLFRSVARGVVLGDLPSMNRVERIGVGLRYERQLTRHLYSQLGYVGNRTTNRTPFAPFDDGTAPYHPPGLAGFALNYINPSGLKLGLQLNYTSRFFQDTGDLTATSRPIFKARTYMDLTFAKEWTVRNELFIRVTNVFNRPAIQFNDVPVSQRRVEVGFIRRF